MSIQRAYKNLAVAVVNQAAKDVQGKKDTLPTDCMDAAEFFDREEDFDFWCAAGDLDTKTVRNRVKETLKEEMQETVKQLVEEKDLLKEFLVFSKEMQRLEKLIDGLRNEFYNAQARIGAK